MTNCATRKEPGYLRVFLLAVGIAVVFFLPFLIMDGGLFIYYGDFNVQQIPFYQLCHDMIRSGETGWNWYTDLGANFVGSYAFYLLGSPFFWLTLPFPSEAVPYLMAPLLMLKMGVAAMTSYGYLKRFVKNPGFAVLGALMYAFSGYSIYNIFFNHFHEVIAFFPLLLIGLEEFVVNDRRGMFALAVGLCACVNYYFFFGEVLFVVIYFCIRLTDQEHFRISLKKFLLLALESVLGLLLSMVLLLPGLLAIMDNPRTGNLLVGWNGIFYGNVQRYGLIIQSLFYPPDIPAYPNFFPDSNAKWSSVSLYLPMVSLSCVLAFCKLHRRHWAKKIFLLSLFIALIPILNSAFSAFNTAYYARWFYMPLLIMALMSAMALEDCSFEQLRSGIAWTGAAVIGFSLIGVFPSKSDGEIVFGQLPKYPERLLCYLLVTVVGLVLTACLIRMSREKSAKKFLRLSTGALSFMIVVTSVMMLMLGKGNATTVHRVKEMGLGGEFSFIAAEEDDFYRIDMYCKHDEHCMDNFPMFWQMPTIHTFHSVVPGSVFTFYDAIGVDRNVASRPDLKYDGLRTLTSCKYLLCYETMEEDPDIDGFVYLTTENEFKIYVNLNYIPMGFTYDYYVDDKSFESCNESRRDRLLLRALHLSDEQIEAYGDILEPLPDELRPSTTADALAEMADERRETVCDSFIRDKKGFSASIYTDQSELVFFTVPYEEGWSATVNGEPVVVENVSDGFMAVKVPAGRSDIRFDYETPGLKLGLLITLGAAAVLALYLVLLCRFSRRKVLIFGRSTAHLNDQYRGGSISNAEDYVGSVLQRSRKAMQRVPLQLPEEETPLEELLQDALSEESTGDDSEKDAADQEPAPQDQE